MSSALVGSPLTYCFCLLTLGCWFSFARALIWNIILLLGFSLGFPAPELAHNLLKRPISSPQWPKPIRACLMGSPLGQTFLSLSPIFSFGAKCTATVCCGRLNIRTLWNNYPCAVLLVKSAIPGKN